MDIQTHKYTVEALDYIWNVITSDPFTLAFTYADANPDIMYRNRFIAPVAQRNCILIVSMDEIIAEIFFSVRVSGFAAIDKWHCKMLSYLLYRISCIECHSKSINVNFKYQENDMKKGPSYKNPMTIQKILSTQYREVVAHQHKPV